MPEDQDIDKELDPNKRLEFGMKPEQIEAMRKAAKKKLNKLAKNWRPIDH